MNTPPYLVIGFYRPRKLRGSVIGPDILKAIAHLKLVPLDDPAHGAQTKTIWSAPALHAEVRRFAQPHGEGKAWHQDGDTTPGSKMNHAAVLWSNKVPTQFRTPDGKIWQPEPFEIVLCRNLACMHRTPPNVPVPPKRRWFFRQRVEVPSHMELP